MLRLALRNCLRRRLRSVLTGLGVAIGVSVVVALIGIAEGGESQFERAMRGQRDDILLFRRGLRLLGRLTPAHLEAVRRVPGVAHADPYVVGQVEVSSPARPADAKPVSVVLLSFPDPDAVHRRFPMQRDPGARAPASGADEAAVGVDAATELGVGVGDTVVLGDRAFRVVGRYRTGAPWQDRGLVLPYDVARDLLNLGDSSAVAGADVVPGEPVAAVVARINATVPAVEAVAAPELLDKFEDQRRIVRALVWAVSLIALLAGGVGVLNTMSMAVLERTREIGLLLAVGWRAAQVRTLLLVESALLSLVGGIAGWGLGVGWAWLAAWLAPELAIEGRFGLALFGTAMALALATGLAGGALPAVAASRLDPVEALRHE